jgi:hypothetical protein
MIRHEGKIRAIVRNAHVFKELVSEFGSFKGYLDHHGFRTDAWDEKMDRLFRDLRSRFDYVKSITTYHFLMDIGAFTAKPDRQVVALLDQLGLLDKENKQRSTISVCRQMAEEANENIRVVDIVLVNMRQASEFGLLSPICRTGCKKCQVRRLCRIPNDDY